MPSSTVISVAKVTGGEVCSRGHRVSRTHPVGRDQRIGRKRAAWESGLLDFDGDTCLDPTAATDATLEASVDAGTRFCDGDLCANGATDCGNHNAIYERTGISANVINLDQLPGVTVTLQDESTLVNTGGTGACANDVGARSPCPPRCRARRTGRMHLSAQGESE